MLALGAAPALAQDITATFTSATTVPVTAPDYTASGKTVNLALGYAPATGTSLTVVNNTGLGFITGTFSNLAQGQAVDLSFGGVTYSFVANYFGGTGNDLVLHWAGTLPAAWGWDGYGQLGDLSSGNQPVPVAVTATGTLAGKTVLTLAAGENHSLALCSDGTVLAWGANDQGQLGDSSTIQRNAPVAITQSGALAGKTVVGLAAGYSHNLALCSDGTIAAWGSNGYGQLGDATTEQRNAPVAVHVSGVLAGKTVVAIAAGEFHSLALCSDGTLVTWGANHLGQLGNAGGVSGLLPVMVINSGVLSGKTPVAIAAGGNHNLVLCADGTVVAWGSGLSGQLGNGSFFPESSPVLVSVDGALAGQTVVGIAAGSSHSLALFANGSVAAWGANDSGQLGDDTFTRSSQPVTVTHSGVLAGKAVVSVQAGWGHNLALCSDGSLVAWGRNVFGQLGDNNGNSNQRVPVAVPAAGYLAGRTLVSTAAGFGHSLALTAAPLAQSISFSNPGTRTLGDAPFELIATASSGLPVSFRIVSGPATLSGNTLSLTGIGTVTVRASQAGDATFAAAAPVERAFAVVNPTFLNAAFSNSTTVPVTTASYNATGLDLNLSLQFAPSNGTSLTVVRNTGPGVFSSRFNNLAQGQAVSLVFGGVTYSFVANYFGGSGNDLVLHWAGSLPAAWGRNNSGQVGDGTLIDRLVPVGVSGNGALAGKTVIALASGDDHNLVVYSDGTVAAWGSNGYRQIGNGNSFPSFKDPVDITSSGALAGKTVISVAASQGHSLALCSDGTVAAWGLNSDGQLGDNTRTDRSSPVDVTNNGVLAGKRVVSIAAGYGHSLALCSDGTVAGWGSNLSYQLGNRFYGLHPSPAAVDTSGILAGKSVVAIAAGYGHSLALCSDGTLVSWGSNSHGQLGNGGGPSFPPAAVNASSALAGKTVASIAAGAYHSLALCTDGTVVAWGSNYRGQLGDNTTTDRNIPVAITSNGALAGKTVVSLKAGNAFSLALCSDGTFATWGENFYGQLGDNTSTNRLVPTNITNRGVLAGKPVVAFSAGATHALALTAPPPPPALTVAPAAGITISGATLSGSVNSYGANANVSFTYGLTTGLGSSVTATPSTISNTSATAVTATLAGLSPGTTYYYRVTAVTGSGTFTSGLQTFTTLAAQTITFANPGTRTFGDEPFALSATASSGLPVTFSVISGPATVNGNTLTLTGTGTVVVRASQSGDPVYAAAPNVEQTFTVVSPATLIATFHNSTTVPVTAASYNATGRPLTIDLQHAPATGSSLTVVNNTGLGFINGRFTNLAHGQAVALTFGGVTYNFVANYYGGSGNDLVLQWAGTLPVGWGWNGFGQLGDSTTTDRLAPVATSSTGVLAGKTVISLASGDGHTLALCSDGTVAAWGKNNFGQLGDNSTTHRLTPVAVNTSGALSGKTVIAIAAGGSHSLALCSDGTVVGWGRNDVGQLGDNSSSHRSVPVAVTSSGVLSGKTVVAIAVGFDHNLALCSDGTVAAWGWNGSGNLGDGTTISRPAPIAVPTIGVLSGKTVVAIAAGGGRSLALCSDGTLAAWGENNFGQLGDNSTTNRSSPVGVVTSGVLSGKTVVSIAAGSFHSLALCSDGTLAAWGWNAFGQLGDNSTTDQPAPIAVPTIGVLSGKTIVSLKAGYAYSLALCSDSTLAAWGDNGSGQLGDTTTTSRTAPVAVTTTGALSGKTITGAAAGTYYTLALAATPPPPVLTVSSATTVRSTGATLNGTVNPFGTSATTSFAYGLTTSFGSSVNASPSPVNGSTPAAVTATLTGLTPATTYYYRLSAVTANGTFTSATETFTTLATQTITFPNPGNKVVGDSPFTLSATASSGLPVSFELVSGPATLNGSTLTLAGSGTVIVRASQAGDSTYDAASPVEISFSVLTAFDSWRVGHFTTAELSQASISGPAADPDRDGASNLLEYAIASHPRLPGGTGQPSGGISATRLQLTFLRARSEVSYQVEASSDLGSWSVIATNPGEVGASVTVEDTAPSGPAPTRRFLRLRVSLP